MQKSTIDQYLSELRGEELFLLLICTIFTLAFSLALMTLYAPYLLLGSLVVVTVAVLTHHIYKFTKFYRNKHDQ